MFQESYRRFYRRIVAICKILKKKHCHKQLFCVYLFFRKIYDMSHRKNQLVF